MAQALEDLLVRQGLCDRASVAAALRRAAEDELPLVAVVAGSLVSENTLAELISAAVGAPVVDLAAGAVDAQALRLLPAEVAARFLVMPLALDTARSTLRAAFADPLDAAAVAAVEQATACQVEALVATVTSVRDAIATHYARNVTTRIVRAPISDIPQESTRRIPRRPTDAEPPAEMPLSMLDEDPASGTTPVHRLEHEATLEQRFEALRLALVDAGVMTHAEYVRALRRLLRGG